jgi:nicotinate-nucleotide pyrophosphorylase (carboxylating)
MNWHDYDEMIDAALAEDCADRDATTLALVDPARRATAELATREAGVIAGLPLAERLVERFPSTMLRAGNAGVTFEALVQDGTHVAVGDIIARLEGPAAAILSLERTMLNFLQHLSGIATQTALYVAAVEGTDAKILDTRKTLPGWRRLAKYAVRCGGGQNHRMNLADQVLIKDNHLALMSVTAGDAGAVQKAICRTRSMFPGLLVELEVDSLAQLKSAQSVLLDMVLLDNMTPDELRQAVAWVREHCPADARPALEASGDITLANVRAVAETGVDRISIGALTHSARALNLGLDMEV